jgi:hypothetical protein
MQTHYAVSTAIMTKFAQRQSGAPTCTHCGQQFYLSFSGGRPVELRCACGAVYGIEEMENEQFIENDATRPVARDVAELDS